MTHSSRNPGGIPDGKLLDSAISKNSKNSHSLTSSQTDALGRGRQSTAALRDIHPLDALAVTVAWIRPDWNIALLRAVLARCNGSHHELAERALRVALDPDARTPAAIENAGPIRRNNVAQTYPTVDEALNPDLDPHGFPVGACPICRKGAA